MNANGVFREEYALDEDGNRVSLRFYDVEDQRVESDWGIYAYEWSLDRRGTVTETRSDRHGEPVSIRPQFLSTHTMTGTGAYPCNYSMRK